MGANLVEAIYIARVSTQALAALSFTFPLVMVFQGIAMGLGIGASSVVARTMGLGNLDKAKQLITHSFVLVMLLTFVICILAYFYIEYVFVLLGAQDDILLLTIDYMQTWIFGLPFFTVAMVGSTLMRAAGDADAFVVTDIDRLSDRLVAAGHKIYWDMKLVDVRRFFVFDPVGNRIEMIAG